MSDIPACTFVTENENQTIVDAVLIQENKATMVNMDNIHSSSRFKSINDELKREKEKINRQNEMAKRKIKFHYDQFKNKLYANHHFNLVLEDHKYGLNNFFEKFETHQTYHEHEFEMTIHNHSYGFNDYVWKDPYFKKAFIRFLKEKIQKMGFRITNHKYDAQDKSANHRLTLKWNGNKKSFIYSYLVKNNKKINKERELEKQRKLKKIN